MIAHRVQNAASCARREELDARRALMGVGIASRAASGVQNAREREAACAVRDEGAMGIEGEGSPGRTVAVVTPHARREEEGARDYGCIALTEYARPGPWQVLQVSTPPEVVLICA